MKHFIIFLIAGMLIGTSAFAQGWEEQNSPTTNALNAVVFVDTSNGWAVGDSGTIVHTTDGGSTWAIQTSGTAEPLQSVDFVNVSNGWAVGGYGTIVRSTDGGGTWTIQPCGGTADLSGVDFIDANNGWVVGTDQPYGGFCIHTTDGGETWNLDSHTFAVSLSGVIFVDANHGWIIGNTVLGDFEWGVKAHTTDGGQTWTVQWGQAFLFALDFVDVGNGWVVGGGYHQSWSTIEHTTDGEAWTTQNGETSSAFYSVDFVDANHGWAVGESGTVVHTRDGGGSWTEQNVGTVNTLSGVAFADVNHGWAVGDGGTILHYVQPPCPSTTVPFMCHYDSLALDTCWFWIRQDTSLWSLSAEPGWMRILADGDLTGWTNDAANILLRCVPDGDVRMETKLAFSPSVGQVVGAGLVIYHDDDNYLNIQQQPDHIRSHSEQDGQTSYFDYEQVWDLTYLRIEKIGSTYRTYASPDSLDWTLVATWEPEWTWDGELWVGLLSVGYVDPPVPADFDYFRVDSLSAASFPHPDTLWTRTYGGNGEDCGYSVQQTEDGGFVVVGTTESFGAGSADYYLVKTNSQGDTLWTRTFGGSGFDEARSVQQTDDGGYVVAGRTYSFGAGNRDFYLVKTNSLGDTLWTRTYGGSGDDWASSVQQTADGGYVVSGTTSSFGAGQGDIYLVKTDVQGDTLWTRTIGGGYTDEGYEVQQTSDGGYIIAGTTRSFGAGNWDYYLVRTDADGEVVWTRTFGGGAGDGGRSVEQTSDGGFIFAGWSCSFSGYYDAYLVKTDANGSTDWDRTYGGWDIDQSEWARQTLDGGFLSVGGTTTFGAGDWDVYLVRTDSLGDALWTTTYGGGGTDRGWALEVASDGGYIVTGQTGSFGAGGSDVYLIRLAPEQTVIADVPHIPLPQELVLHQNYPNPFNPFTMIAFDLPKAGHISLRVFDLLGREVAVLKEGIMEAGSHRVMFDGGNLASGIYFARLEAGEFTQTKKLMLLK